MNFIGFPGSEMLMTETFIIIGILVQNFQEVHVKISM